MQFPESWLRAFCDPPLSSRQLADLLTMAGMEVEELRPAAPPFSGVVVGRIVDAQPHPQADRLRVCRVEAGAITAAGLLQVVCGAPNARVGLLAPLALEGAQLPPGADGAPIVIRKGLLRGVESQGMLCSARELQLSEDHGGLLELPSDARVGEDLRRQLTLDDMLFTLKLTPNLGHLLSVYGIAREVAALTGAPLKAPQFDPVEPRHGEVLPVRVQAPDLCGRFSGRIVRNVNPGASTPRWMVDRLARCGQRSVSALVDISNYVMFEYGRPTHIFDLEKIHGGLEVRWGRPGETLELLNGSTIEVDGSVGVIADEVAVESLAGIMGGEATATSASTRHVYVEAAFWWPDAVAGRSRRFGFATDAGHRFERGVDPSQTVAHIEHITRLIIDICGGEAGPMDDQIVALPEQRPVTLRVERASKVIGMPVSQEECAEVFTRLGMDFSESPGRVSVVPPSWRFDLRIEEDLIEEVIRIIGYDKLPDSPPQAAVVATRAEEARRSSWSVRHALAALDYQETISFSFVEERWERELAGNADPIRVLNPIAAPLAVMRSSLIGSLVDTLKRNLARRASRVRIFELGRTYRRDPSQADGERSVAGLLQPMRLGGLAYGSAAPAQWGQTERVVDFFDLKGDLEALLVPSVPRFTACAHPALHPGRCAQLELDGVPIGVLGELHPRWRQAYELPQAPIVFELDLDAVRSRDLPQHRPLTRLQPVWRDVALVVGADVAHDALIAALRDDAQHLIRDAVLFDVFEPKQLPGGWQPGERSMAVRLELLPQEHTLTDEQIQQAVDAAVGRAQRHVGARLRG